MQLTNHSLDEPGKPTGNLQLLLYALAPFNFVVPILGAVDDMVLIPLALHYVLKLLPGPITQGFSRSRRMHGFA